MHLRAASETERDNNDSRLNIAHKMEGDAMSEGLSACMDGQLNDEQAHQLLSQLTRDSTLRSDWDCYHLIGDTLRGVGAPDIYARIADRLDAEPTLLTPLLRRSKTAIPDQYIYRVAASLAALAFVGTTWISLNEPQFKAPQFAMIPAPEVKPPFVPAGEDARGYLLAHQRFSTSTTMLGLVAYARIFSPVNRQSADWVTQ